MALSFSRSVRSLQQDRFVPALAGLVIGTLLLIAWSAWFFLAKVTLYETSSELDVRRDGALIATFTPEALGRLRPGQSAMLHLATGAGGEMQSFPAVVMTTPSASEEDAQVELFVYSPEPLQPGLTGQVRVEVEYVSPAVLALRSAGQLGDTPKLTLSPQTLE